MKVTKLTIGLVKLIKSGARNSHDEEVFSLCKSWIEQRADAKFLLDRCTRAGSISFREGRDTGISSNSIVAIAFGKQKLKDQRLPSDQSDLDACTRAWNKLPLHRKTKRSREALNRATRYVCEKEARRQHE